MAVDSIDLSRTRASEEASGVSLELRFDRAQLACRRKYHAAWARTRSVAAIRHRLRLPVRVLSWVQAWTWGSFRIPGGPMGAGRPRIRPKVSGHLPAHRRLGVRPTCNDEAIAIRRLSPAPL